MALYEIIIKNKKVNLLLYTKQRELLLNYNNYLHIVSISFLYLLSDCFH